MTCERDVVVKDEFSVMALEAFVYDNWQESAFHSVISAGIAILLNKSHVTEHEINSEESRSQLGNVEQAMPSI